MAGRKKTVLVSLGTVIVAGGVAALAAVGCGSSNGAGGGSTTDSGTDTSTLDSGSMKDSSNDAVNPTPGDAGKDAEAAAPAVPPRVFLVNASPDSHLAALRFCFGVGPMGSTYSVFGYPALPDTANPGAPYPGLFAGTGGEFKSPVAGIDLGSLTLTLYAVNAANPMLIENTADGGTGTGGAEQTCDVLLGATGDGGTLVPGQDYWQLTTIPQGTLKDQTNYVVAITGCLAGLPFDGGAGMGAYCGTDYSPTAGNVKITTFQLDNTTALDGGSIGVQFAHASTPFAAAAGQAPADAGPWFQAGGAFTITAPPADAGPEAGRGIAQFPILAQMSFGTVTQTTLTPFSGLDFSGASGVFVTVANLQHVQAMQPVAEPFPVVTELTYGASPVPDGGAPQNGKGFAFVLVGDPAQSLLTNPQDGGPIYVDAGASPNLYAAHFLVFPTANP
jgi:hypothetical protein